MAVNATLNLALDRTSGRFSVDEGSTRLYVYDAAIDLSVGGWTRDEVAIGQDGKTMYEPYFQIVCGSMVLAEAKLNGVEDPEEGEDGYFMTGTLSTNTVQMAAMFCGCAASETMRQFEARIFSTTSANPIATGRVSVWSFPSGGSNPANLPSASEALAALRTDLDNHTENEDIHVTAQEKAAWTGKQNALTFDSAPTEGSQNPVTSGGVKAALDAEAQARAQNNAALGNAISAEATARHAADDELGEDIAEERNRAEGEENRIQGDLNTHKENFIIHVTATDKAAWDAKVDPATLLGYVNGGAYDSETRRILFKHDSTTIAWIDATPFILDGMVDSAYITPDGAYLVITFNTDSGKQPINIPLTDIFNPDNYYNKTAADAKFVAKVAGKGLSTNDYTDEDKAKVADAATEDDVELTPNYSQTPTFSSWQFSAPGGMILLDPRVGYSSGTWTFYESDEARATCEGDEDAVSLEFDLTTYVVTATRTRTDVLSYRLGTAAGPNADKPLATAAQGAKADAALPKSDVIDPASASATGKAADALKVKQALAGKATKADATLNLRGSNHDGFSDWYVTPVYPSGYTSYTGPTWVDEHTVWVITFTGHPTDPDATEAAEGSPGRDAISLEFTGGTTATRTVLKGYMLGDQYTKPLASEAEAEALRMAVAAKYAKPSGGIPKSDLASTVQASLGLADTAAQPSALVPKADRSELCDAWAANTVYKVTSFVIHDNAIYRCTTAHTSGSSWDSTKWTATTIADVLALYLPKRGGTMTGDIEFGNSGMTLGEEFGLVRFRSVSSNVSIPSDRDGEVALMPDIPYSLGTPIVIDTASSETVEGETVYYGAATLANRTANVVQVTAATALDELRITFPAATSGKVRDFGLRVEIGTGSAALTAPALVPIAPTGETIKIENADGTIPALADGTATAKGVTLLYFSEISPGVFVVKGEQVEEVA